MYFTNEEKPIGPGNTGTVNFGTNDQLEGRVHTNGDIVFSSYGCPDFSGSVTITNEAVENGGGIGGWGACDEGVFEQNIDGETVNILDTIATITFPPENSAQLVRANADYVFNADDMLFRSGKKDTMVMTEINFTESGFGLRSGGITYHLLVVLQMSLTLHGMQLVLHLKQIFLVFILVRIMYTFQVWVMKGLS